MADARAAALAALLHVDENEGFSNLVLDKTLARFALEPRDAALASAIFYGVLERRLTLDYYIGQFARTPIHKICLLYTSKAVDSQIAYLVVDIKAEIEKIREQIQNIE